MPVDFDPGYARNPWKKLVREYPGTEVYPTESFRVEWGPVFHRGRLDGSARILVIGQDPAAHEAICRRILVGEAGQRTQGLLNKLGITTGYLMINCFLYSVFGQHAGNRHIDDEPIADYRNRWIDTALERNEIDAILTLGGLAAKGAEQWKSTPAGADSDVPVIGVIHPTYPNSAPRGGKITKAEAFKRLCDDWNDALDQLGDVVTPDDPVPLVHYGDTITEEEKGVIPACDLPAGMPRFMRESEKSWAQRTGDDADAKRGTITVKVPTGFRDWPGLD